MRSAFTVRTSVPDTTAETLLILPHDWTEPLRLDSLFDAHRPLEVDVGCGKGRFLIARAKSHPDTNFIGIERRPRRIAKLDRRILAQGIRNIRLLNAEASYAAGHLLPPVSVSTYYLFFPDPWPKRRHHCRRLFTPEFLDAVYGTLVQDGTLHITTDHLEYFAWIRRTLGADARFVEIPPFRPAEEERTSFELVFLAQGKPIGRCSFQKVVG